MRVITYDPKNAIKAKRVDVYENTDLAENENETYLVMVLWSNGASTSEGRPDYESACEYANRIAERSGIKANL